MASKRFALLGRMAIVTATILMAAQVSNSTVSGIFSKTKELCSGFLPENNMKIPVGLFSTGGITEAQFNLVMDRIEKLYTADVQAKGGRLKVNRLWSDATVNASATQSGGVWSLNMYGGLARHPATNIEGMALVACHEMGHHIGGAPKISGWFGSWATNEGGSDYFATLKCLRRFFAEDDNKTILASEQIDPTVQAACVQQYPDEQEQLICLRTSLGGDSVAKLFMSLSKETKVPAFNTPDTSVVRKTNDRHPATQCRMDTYFAGMLCPVNINDSLSDTNYKQGSCYAPRDTVGIRPSCWFAAN